MSLEEELKQLRQVVPKDRHLDDFVQLGKNYMVDEALRLLRVRTEKIREIFERYINNFPIQIEQVEKEVLAELTTTGSGEE